VPDDVAVVGFDDSPVALRTSPPLTTVRQPFDQLAREMVRLLVARIAEEDVGSVVLPTTLVRRGSA
jgi:DNA-binding LacI/PurR family transcriptional regulator